jgi:polysaccharide export outer membrane protein
MKISHRNIEILGLVLLMAQWTVDAGTMWPATQKPVASTSLDNSPQIGPSSAGSAEELPIGPGDLIEISLYGSQDFSETVRVSDSNSIMLPLIGSVEVVGISPREAAELIRKRLMDGNFYTNPQISVFVKEYATEGVYVLGEVQKPGFYSILNAHDVMQAISLAGGTTPKAGKVVTIKNPKRPDPLTINLASTQAGKPDATGKADVRLMPADEVMVSKAGIVYVIGDVHLPTGIIMESENLTVLQAIALAQGTNPTAALNDVRLIRPGLDGPKEESISLKKILEAKAPDTKVQADDIIFVPVSTAKAASRRGIESILQAVTGIAMYARY